MRCTVNGKVPTLGFRSALAHNRCSCSGFPKPSAFILFNYEYFEAVNKLIFMPPQRIRNGFDDSRSEASSTRDKQSVYTGISKGRRNGTSTLAGSNLKDVTNAHSTPSGQQGDTAVTVRISRLARD